MGLVSVLGPPTLPGGKEGAQAVDPAALDMDRPGSLLGDEDLADVEDDRREQRFQAGSSSTPPPGDTVCGTADRLLLSGSVLFPPR